MKGLQAAQQHTDISIATSHKFIKVDFKTADDTELQDFFKLMLSNQITIMENQKILLNKSS